MNSQAISYKNFWALLVKFLRPYWRPFLVLLFLYFLASLFTAIQPVIMAPVLEVAVRGPEGLAELGAAQEIRLNEVDLNNVGRYILQALFPRGADAWNVVLTIGLLYLAVAIVLHLLNFAVYLLGINIRLRAGRDMQADLFSHVLGLSLDFFNRRKTGELISRLDKDTDSVVYGLENITRTIIVSSILVAIYGTLLLRTSLRLSLFVVAAAIVQHYLIQLFRRPLQARIREQLNAQARTAAYIQEVISSIRIIKSFAAEAYERSRIKHFAGSMAQALMRSGFYKHVDEPITAITNAITNVVILLFATSEMLSGRLSTSGFFLYLYMGRASLEPLTALARTIKMIQSTYASSERVQELYAELPSVVDGPVVKRSFDDSIRFEEVSFNYGYEAVLEGVSFDVRKGETTALVGPSGAGKSTIIDLILRFYDPQKGRVQLDGIDIKELKLKEYRKLMGVVTQESILFNASVAQNIVYPDSEIDQIRMENATKVANADQFVQNLPEGYETTIGDRGVLLSGGQKQRLTIARAIYHNPQLLILDEATSSLDTESERQVQKAIDQVVGSTTAIVIAHRLSTVLNADKIIVLDKGELIDQGKHGELYNRCELYQNLCKLQFETEGLSNGETAK